MSDQLSKIRFGIICDGFQFPDWQAKCINYLLAEDDIELALLIRDSNEKSNQKESFLWKLYDKFYVQKRSKSLKSTDLSTQFSKIPRLKFSLQKEDINKESLEKIKEYQLDFILNLNPQELTGPILEAAKFGMWSFHHGNLSINSIHSSCFWEIFNQNLITEASLIRLSSDNSSVIILKQGCLKTELFYPKNIDKIHYESAKWPAKLCHDIRNNHFENLESQSKKQSSSEVNSPSNFQLIWFFFIQLKILLKKAYKTLFITDYWNVGVAKAPIQSFLNPEKPLEVEWFPKLPKNKFIADPFGFYYQNELHIIYEDFLFNERLGTTAALEFKDGKYTDNGIVIKEDFHMSYPFTFEYEGEIYCIPETYQANQVRLYKAVEFPKKWQLDRVLIDNYAGIDNTLLKYGDYWWLFSTDKFGGHNCNLNIHFTKDLFGEWIAHPKNPVKTDIRSARPAGTIFSKDGYFFRPSMDYSEKVEGRIVINKIIKLTTTDYKEESIKTIDPYSNTYFSDKIHTLSEAGNFTIIDGAKELFVLGNIHALKYKLISLIRKLNKT